MLIKVNLGPPWAAKGRRWFPPDVNPNHRGWGMAGGGPSAGTDSPRPPVRSCWINKQRLRKHTHSNTPSFILFFFIFNSELCNQHG